MVTLEPSEQIEVGVIVLGEVVLHEFSQFDDFLLVLGRYATRYRH